MAYKDTKKLESAIVLRIIDCLGIFSKDMPDIRNHNFATKVNNIWAIKNNIENYNSIVILYSEIGDKKVLLSSMGADKDTWVCVVCGDAEEESVEMNKVYLLNIIKDKWSIREIDTIELANLFTTFECFRTFFSGWEQYDAKEEELSIIKKFVSSLSEAETE